MINTQRVRVCRGSAVVRILRTVSMDVLLEGKTAIKMSEMGGTVGSSVPYATVRNTYQPPVMNICGSRKTDDPVSYTPGL